MEGIEQEIRTEFLGGNMEDGQIAMTRTRRRAVRQWQPYAWGSRPRFGVCVCARGGAAGGSEGSETTSWENVDTARARVIRVEGVALT